MADQGRGDYKRGVEGLKGSPRDEDSDKMFLFDIISRERVNGSNAN